MVKEQKEKFDAIVATGRLNAEQLARLRAGFEKAPRKIDIKKLRLHMNKVMNCLRLEKLDPNIEVDWSPEDDDGDAYIFIAVPAGYIFTDPIKRILLDAASAADTVSYMHTNEKGMLDTSIITLGFIGIIKDPNKPDNFSAN